MLGQQGGGRVRVQAGYHQLGQTEALEAAGVTLPGAEDQRDPVGVQAAGDEQQRLGRGRVKPMRIVDEADDGPFLGRLGQ